MFFKIGVLKSFTVFTGNTCVSLFLIKLQAFRSATLLKRDSNTDVSCEYCENFKNSFFHEKSQKLKTKMLSESLMSDYSLFWLFLSKQIILASLNIPSLKAADKN